MNRLQALAAHPRRTLGALAVVLAAAGITVGSGADFTAASANPSNTFSTGTLSIGNSQSSAILSAAGLKPGATATGTVDIENSGSLVGRLLTGHLRRTGQHPLAARPARPEDHRLRHLHRQHRTDVRHHRPL